MGHPMRLELTREGLLISLANHYTTRGALSFQGLLLNISDSVNHVFQSNTNNLNTDLLFQLTNN